MTVNKKVKITYNNLDKNVDIDVIFREMDRCYTKVNSELSKTDVELKSVADSFSNISVEIINKDTKENNIPKKMSFKKFLDWYKK